MTKNIGFLLALAFALACTDKQKILSGNEFPFHDGTGEVQTVTMMPATIRPFTAEGVPRGDGNYLHLGTYEGFDGSFAIRFPVDSTSAITVDSAWLWLTVHRLYPRIPGEMRVRVFEIENYWRESGNPSLGDLQIGVSPISDTLITTTLQDTVYDLIPVPAEVIQRWVDQPGTNNGVLVSFSGATFMKEYYSLEGTPTDATDEQGQTSLRVAITESNGTHSVKAAIPNNDITFLTGSVPEPAQRFVIDNNSAKRLYVRFSVDSLPRELYVNDASLVFTLDGFFSEYRAEEDVLIVAHPVVSGDENSENPAYRDSTAYLGLLSGEQLILNIAEAVQLWGSGYEPNLGLVIRSAREGDDFQWYSLFTADADTTRTPKVYVRYTLPVRRY